MAQRRGIPRAIVAVARRLAVGSAPDVGRWEPAEARTAPRFLRLPDPRRRTQESLPARRSPVLLRQKNVLTGTTGGVSSEGPPIVPPISGKGAGKIAPLHPSHPIMRRLGADLEEKREPRERQMTA